MKFDEKSPEERLRAIQDLFKDLTDISAYPIITKSMLRDDIVLMAKDVSKCMDNAEFDAATKRIWKHIGYVNKYIQCTEPWKLVKADKKDEVEEIFYTTARSLEAIAILIWPIMPQTSDKVMDAIGLPPIVAEVGVSHAQRLMDGLDREYYELNPGPPLFMKIDKKENR